MRGRPACDTTTQYSKSLRTHVILSIVLFEPGSSNLDSCESSHGSSDRNHYRYVLGRNVVARIVHSNVQRGRRWSHLSSSFISNRAGRCVTSSLGETEVWVSFSAFHVSLHVQVSVYTFSPFPVPSKQAVREAWPLLPRPFPSPSHTSYLSVCLQQITASHATENMFSPHEREVSVCWS